MSITEIPLISAAAAGLKVSTPTEKRACVTMPEDTVRESETTEIGSLTKSAGERSVVAITLTGVAIVPEITVAATRPLASVVADTSASVRPPVVRDSSNVTSCPATGFPEPSLTSNVTCALSSRPTPPPVPCRAILAGVALMKVMKRSSAAGAALSDSVVVALAGFGLPD